MVYRLTRKELNMLISRLGGRTVSFGKNEHVTQANGREQIGFVASGAMYFCVENDAYERNIIRIFREGEYFSSDMLAPFYGGVSYLAAKRPTEAVYFRSSDIFGLCRADPAWGQRLINAAAGQAEEMTVHCCMLQQRSVRDKLICFFRREKFLQQSDTVTLPMPYSDLADYLAVDRAAMMRELKKMKDDGLLSSQGRTAVLHI